MAHHFGTIATGLLAAGIAVQCACSSPALRDAQITRQTSEAAAVTNPASAPASTLLAGGNQLVIPMRVVNGFIMVDGQVGDQAGAFMFDTGNPINFLLNNHFIPLPLTNKIGTGSVGSGQQLTVFAHADISPIQFGGQILTNVGTVRSADFEFVERGVYPKLLGFAGYALFKDYEFVVDYDRESISFYATRADGEPIVQHANPQDIVAALSFRVGPAEQIPLMTFRAGDMEMQANVDTGALGDLELTAESRRALEASGHLKQVASDYALTLDYSGTTLILTSPKLSTAEGNSINLGYNFLRDYRTVWNYKKRTLTLLRRRS